MAHIYDFRLVKYGFRVVISGIFKSGTYDCSVVIYDSRAFTYMTDQWRWDEK